MTEQRGFVVQIQHTNARTSPNELDGKTFQLHYQGDDLYRAYEVTIGKTDDRCPVIVGGERCGDKAGHSGKHMWLRGD